MPSPLLAHRETFVSNLLTIWQQATPFDLAEGKTWYADASELVQYWALEHNRSVENVAACVAVLSPQCEWSRNKQIAGEMLRDGYPTTQGALGLNVTKAQRVLEERLINTRDVMSTGAKVYNFSRNLAGDFSVATVDQHMIEACWNDPTYYLYPKAAGYRAYADSVVMAADEAGEDVAMFQSVIWHVWKRLNPTGAKRAQRTKFNAARRAA